MEDNQVLKHIEKLVDDEEHLYSKGNLTDDEVKQLHKMKVELDQYWDFLRQRRSLRDAGQNPDDANIDNEDEITKQIPHYILWNEDWKEINNKKL
jgi:flagellar biosynthesis/type III secretory pathway chaperone